MLLSPKLVEQFHNLETHNAQMIREGRSKAERFQILKEIAEYQLNILKAAEKIKLIEEQT